jgi:hypothetical protein
MTALRAFAITAVLGAAPRVALACPVCSGGTTEQVQDAFLSATLFMTFLPLGLIAVFGYALRRRLLRLAAQEAADDVRES